MSEQRIGSLSIKIKMPDVRAFIEALAKAQSRIDSSMGVFLGPISQSETKPEWIVDALIELEYSHDEHEVAAILWDKMPKSALVNDHAHWWRYDGPSDIFEKACEVINAKLYEARSRLCFGLSSRYHVLGYWPLGETENELDAQADALPPRQSLTGFTTSH